MKAHEAERQWPAAAALGLFAGGLLSCVLLEKSVLYALIFGYVIFFGYGLLQKHSVKDLLSMSLSGIQTVKHVLFTFLFIGMLTAAWRGSGTIAYLVSAAARVIRPAIIVPITFLLCCGISLLTGTAFGAAATAGVIAMAIGVAMGADKVLMGGAILAGAYFGDRCSPMSTSALLVASLTKTDIYRNVRAMLKTALVPFLGSLCLYGILGALRAPSDGAGVSEALFGNEYVLHWTCLLPAALVIVLAACRLNVRLVMAAGAASAGILCIFLQKMPPLAFVKMLVVGYQAADPALAAMLDGGGILSMVNVAAIVCLSSSYAGLFQGTGLLSGLQGFLSRLTRGRTLYFSMLLTAVLTGLIACNQTLTILLTHQLTGPMQADPSQAALDLEDSAVTVSPLVPWSIAGAVPLSLVSAGAGSLPYALFLWLLPLWRLACGLLRKKETTVSK